MACQQGRVFGRVRSSEKRSRHFYLMRRHSRAGGNPDLWLSEIFNDYRSVGFAHGYGLRQYQLRRVSYISRGQSPRYGCRLQTPASRLKKQFPHPCQPCRHSREGGNPDLRLSEIFNYHRSVDFAYGYGLRQYQLRRVSYISRGRSPRYVSRLQIPASRLKKHTPHPCLLRRHSRAGGNPDL